jgi:tetratricopeptide (TPR) repeat protein
MTTLTISGIDPALFARADNLLARAITPTVTTRGEYEDAADLLKAVKAFAREIEDARKAAVEPLNAQVKTINDSAREPAARAKEAEAALKKALLAYEQEQERQRQEREAELRRQQAAEQARLRQETEAREAAERERARKAREKAEAAAKAAAEAGRAERAEAILEQARIAEAARVTAAAAEAEAKREAAAMMPQAIVVHQEPPKVPGLSRRKVWKFRIDDVTKLPPEYLIANEKRIGAVVKALGEDANIPGVTVYAESVMAASA